MSDRILAALRKGSEAEPVPVFIEPREDVGLGLEELRQLRRSAAEHSRGGLQVEGVGIEHVEGLGQEGREVVVLGIDVDPAGAAPRLPEEARARSRLDRSPDLPRQAQAKPEEGHAEVLALAPSFARLGAEAGGTVDEDDGRLDLVPVLAARSRPPGPRRLALGGEPLVVETGGVGTVAALGPGSWGRLSLWEEPLAEDDHVIAVGIIIGEHGGALVAVLEIEPAGRIVVGKR